MRIPEMMGQQQHIADDKNMQERARERERDNDLMETL